VLARNLLFLSLCTAGLAALGASLSPARPAGSHGLPPVENPSEAADFQRTLERLDAELRRQWAVGELTPAPRASDLAIARRLSLALVGTIPSLEELRLLESQPAERRLDGWLAVLLADRRHHHYLAERLARSFVGVQEGPFIIYRRRRFVTWLADELAANRPYDQIVRQLIADNGLWTDRPATNFITVTIKPDQEQGPDESELAARVSRAFLGMRIDCAECHDHPFERWTQDDFEGMAAFFGRTNQTFTGIRDTAGEHLVEVQPSAQQRKIEPRVPFEPELLPAEGNSRQRLADWVTHSDNRAFSRAIANRLWALLFGTALVEPVDDIRLDGDIPAMLDILADDFAAHGYNLRRLIRLIASTEAYRLDSRSDGTLPHHEITPEHEEAWAAFPITRLRPEQVVGSVLQSASLETIDYESHILVRLARAIGQQEFVKRYGDAGEDELAEQGGTIPQRLLMMNGELVTEETKDDLLGNAATRIAVLAHSDARAVETAYLAILTRRPSEAEAEHFISRLSGACGKKRVTVIGDLYWALINSTEFSWNH